MIASVGSNVDTRVGGVKRDHLGRIAIDKTSWWRRGLWALAKGWFQAVR